MQELWPRCVVFARMKPDDKINAAASNDKILHLAWHLHLGCCSSSDCIRCQVVKYLQGRGLVVGWTCTVVWVARTMR